MCSQINVLKRSIHTAPWTNSSGQVQKVMISNGWLKFQVAIKQMSKYYAKTHTKPFSCVFSEEAFYIVFGDSFFANFPKLFEIFRDFAAYSFYLIQTKVSGSGDFPINQLLRWIYHIWYSVCTNEVEHPSSGINLLTSNQKILIQITLSQFQATMIEDLIFNLMRKI